jgi:hypothetical protein
MILRIVEIDPYHLEGESVTRPDSHDYLRRKVLGRFLDDVRVLFALVQRVLEHALRLREDHRFQGKPGVLEFKIGFAVCIQKPEVVEVPFLHRDIHFVSALQPL